MKERGWFPQLPVARLFVFAGLVFLVGCASAKKPAVWVSLPGATFPLPAPKLELQPVPVIPAPPVLEQSPRQNLIETAVQRARDWAEQGESLGAQGKIEDARQCLKDALDMVKGFETDFPTQPWLEQTYFALLGQVQALELQSELTSAEPQYPELETTPLEEISSLNLYTIEVDPRLAELVSQDLLETQFDIPVVLNDDVVKFLNYYQGRGRRIMEEGLRRSGRYLPLIRKIFEEERVPLDLAYMAHVESLFKPRAVSRARARGMWQFVAGTGRRYGLAQNWCIEERYDVAKSTRAAARHLKDLYAEFGDWNLAMAAYNVGAVRIARIQRRFRSGPLDYWAMLKRRLLPRETRNYVPSILASIIIFRHPARYGFEITPEPPLDFETVEIKEQVDLQVVGDLISVLLEELVLLNPELKHTVTPDQPSGYNLKVPAAKGELLKAGLITLPPSQRVRVLYHQVRSGETLSLIARRYATSVEAIAQMNRLRSLHRLKLGQELVIPRPGWRQSPSARSSPPIPAPAGGHVVREGESLDRIARIYGLKVEDLLKLNNLRRDTVIYPGQRIRLSADRAQVGAGSQTDIGGTR